MQEIWKTYYKSKRTLYEVSDHGNVRCRGVLITPSLTNSGYLRCTKDLIHRMVAKAFIPNPDNKPCIDHIDGNKLNNKAENLRWCTYSENMLNPITRKHNSEIKHIQNKGELNPMYGNIRPDKWRKNHSEKMKGRYTGTKIMNDGYTQLKVKPEYWGEFIDIGFKFGTINR